MTGMTAPDVAARALERGLAAALALGFVRGG